MSPDSVTAGGRPKSVRDRCGEIKRPAQAGRGHLASGQRSRATGGMVRRDNGVGADRAAAARQRRTGTTCAASVRAVGPKSAQLRLDPPATDACPFVRRSATATAVGEVTACGIKRGETQRHIRGVAKPWRRGELRSSLSTVGLCVRIRQGGGPSACARSNAVSAHGPVALSVAMAALGSDLAAASCGLAPRPNPLAFQAFTGGGHSDVQGAGPQRGRDATVERRSCTGSAASAFMSRGRRSRETAAKGVAVRSSATARQRREQAARDQVEREGPKASRRGRGLAGWSELRRQRDGGGACPTRTDLARRRRAHGRERLATRRRVDPTEMRCLASTLRARPADATGSSRGGERRRRSRLWG